MSHPRLRKPRPLGSLRHIQINNPDRISQVPALPQINHDLKDGIHGNAMAVPPPQESNRSRPPTDERPKSDKKTPKSTTSSDSAVSHENCEKEIKEGLGREKALKDQVASLQKQIAELKIALRGKEEENKQLQQSLEDLEKELRAGLNAEKASHEETRGCLQKTQVELQEAQTKIDTLELQHQEQLNKLKEQFDQELKDSLAAKDAEIADRDQKLSRLKAQMADALKGNSWERQQQLEELTKELTRIQEESDLLRMKIKAMSKNKQGHCTNCADQEAKVKKLMNLVKEKDDSIKELKSLCDKFETQLTTQDKLLEQWAQSKGHKIAAPK